MCKVIHRISLPCFAGTMVRMLHDTVHDGVAEVHVGACHVNLGTEHHLAFLYFACVHFLEQFQAFFYRTVTVARHIFLGAYSKCLGRGGITDLSNLTGVSRATITTGQKDISKIKPDPRGRGGDPASFRIRAEGAGRKTSIQKYPGIKEALLLLLDGNIVGNPENPLCWTTKSLRNLADELAKQNMPITYPTVGTLLEDMGFSLQQNRKYMESGEAGPDRDEQFKFINQTAKSFLDQSLPVISVDTKKKELIGNYKNNGAEYHPVKSAPKEGFVNVGLSADTGAFAVNSIRSWWTAMGKEHYPDARKLMITADGGGSNGRRNKLWKTSLQEFANESRLEISVCHFGIWVK